MSNLSDDLIALKAILERQSILPEPQEGDYAEEDENSVVHIKRADGTPILMMSLMDYLDWVSLAIDGRRI